MNRQEHLDWAKKRALEYVEQGDFDNALASMTSDLGKHDELRDRPAIMLGLMQQMTGNLQNADRIRHWIEGFN